MGAILLLAFVSLISHPLTKRLGRRAFLVLAALMAGAFAVFITLAIPVFAGNTLVEHVEWIPQLNMALTLRLDPLSALFSLLVTGAGALVLLYCANYFDDGELGIPRFAGVFMGFATSMLGLVVADNVYLLFIFWEATTVFSFLLIGHVTRLRTANSAALQALMITTLGGLAMLVGFVLLVQAGGTPLLSEIIASPPEGTLVTVSVYLILLGAISKSAIFPFHFWLPGAMAAPTPVSAYLHAAAMVKAGVYLIARMSEPFADVPGYRWALVILGGITMLVGGFRALRQFDIKLIVAQGTVSQLGLLVMVIGVGDPRVTFAGLVLLFAHAVAKAPLFLTVGIIDYSTGVRDLRRLSGIGRRFPALLGVAIVASASMAGVPPFFGFVAKEAAFAELLEVGHEHPVAIVALVVAVIGSVLTVAYMVRFLWGAFASKPGVADTPLETQVARSIVIAPALFAAVAVFYGVASPLLDPLVRASVPLTPLGAPEHLSIWHGWTVPLLLSGVILLLGVLLFFPARRLAVTLPPPSERLSGSHAYWVATHMLDTIAVRFTSLTQRGSLPFYLAVILSVMVVALGGTVLSVQQWPEEISFISSPVDIPIAIVMIVAALFAMRARTRFQGGLLVGVTGYGMATIFALHGAPDLALTQLLVETVTLIAFVLVIRRLPAHMAQRPRRATRVFRLALGLGVGLVLGAVAVVSLGARIADPISAALPQLAVEGGHGYNVVNVMLVDIRAWDTMGELSVVLAAATGVASLVFLNTRVDQSPHLSRREARNATRAHLLRVADPEDPASRMNWLLAGNYLRPERRSIILEVVVRLVFHGLLILSVFLLLSGHNLPGGGFAAGLVAGLALVARYLAGGRHELRATVSLDAGRILGIGLALAVSMAIVPLFFGQPALSSSWVDLDLGPFGSLPLVTSTLFDIGVYLVVFGLVLDVLRSLGSEIDEHEEADNAEFAEEAAR
ncbi:Na+/H+ antiporter subunit A [Leucobacter albus]|uniref:Na+/H+ antiporter subunit A n=1 Tax=Leucobacter albus TaxID=272210 RepID=A0ABW3TQX0_9MICO